MFQVFIDYDKLQEICLDQDENDPWFNILRNQTSIGINKDDNVWQDTSNPVFLFSMGNNIMIEDKSSLMNDIPTNKKRVLENPCGAYILPIKPTDASPIQQFYGVMCQSSEGQLTTKPLLKNSIVFKKANAKGQTWGRLSSCSRNSPTNTLIIQDRYFFSKEKGETINDSYENFEEIIKVLLPKKSSEVFHLLMIFDSQNADSSCNFDDISKHLQRIVDRVVAPMRQIKKVILEVLSAPVGSYKYDKTHDRHIISNYYYIDATHKLKAFRGTTPLDPLQKITCQFLYSTGLDGESDFPEEWHRELIKTIRDIVAQAKNTPPGYYLYYRRKDDGTIDSDVKNIKNRLLI